MVFHRWLKAARLASGKSLDDVAAALGCTRSNVGHWETGRHRVPPQRVDHLYDALGLSSDQRAEGDRLYLHRPKRSA